MTDSMLLSLNRDDVQKLTELAQAQSKSPQYLATEVLSKFISENHKPMSTKSEPRQPKSELGRPDWLEGQLSVARTVRTDLTPDQEQFIDEYCEVSNIQRSEFLQIAVARYIAWLNETNKQPS